MEGLEGRSFHDHLTQIKAVLSNIIIHNRVLFLVCLKAVKGRLFVWEAFTTYFSSEAGGPLASSIIISRNQKALLRPNNNVISGNFISMSCHFSLNLVTPFTIFYKSLYFVSPYNINTLNSECVYMCVCIYVVSVCMRVCVLNFKLYLCIVCVEECVCMCSGPSLVPNTHTRAHAPHLS